MFYVEPDLKRGAQGPDSAGVSPPTGTHGVSGVLTERRRGLITRCEGTLGPIWARQRARGEDLAEGVFYTARGAVRAKSEAVAEADAIVHSTVAVIVHPIADFMGRVGGTTAPLAAVGGIGVQIEPAPCARAHLADAVATHPEGVGVVASATTRAAMVRLLRGRIHIVDEAVTVIVQTITDLVPWVAGGGAADRGQLIDGAHQSTLTDALTHAHSADLVQALEAFVDGPVAVIVDPVAPLLSGRAARHADEVTLAAYLHALTASAQALGLTGDQLGREGLVYGAVAVVVDVIADLGLGLTDGHTDQRALLAQDLSDEACAGGVGLTGCRQLWIALVGGAVAVVVLVVTGLVLGGE